MKITRNILFFGILLFELTTVLLVLLNIQYFYFRTIISFFFLATIPGFLIMLLLKIKEIGFWEYLVYTIGLSVAFLMLGGLTINWILPWLHITDKPLSLTPLLISFGIILSVFEFIAYKRNEKISLKVSLPKLNLLNKIFVVAPLIFAILSILGAITLNNGGSNYLTMIMLSGIAVFIFSEVLLRDKLNDNIFPWTILIISMSLLLMFSLRSWYIAGWDIHQEYYFFQLTKNVGHWTINNSRDAYNACLSITILPTIYSLFLFIPDQYIFKIIYPLIFSIIPLVLYLFLTKNTSKINALLASFFFLSQPTFFSGYPMVLRQGIAILLFELFLYVLINKKLKMMSENILLYIFGFSMIVSHYSTAYVTLTILIIAFVLNLLILKSHRKTYFFSSHSIFNTFLTRMKKQEFKISGNMLLIFILFTYLWFGLLTKATNGIIIFTKETINNLGNVFSPELQHVESSFINQFNIFYNQDMNYQLIKYSGEIVNEYKYIPQIHLFKTTANLDVPTITYSQLIPIAINPNFSIYIIRIFIIIKIIMKLLLVIGIPYLLILELKKKRLNKEFIFLIPASFMLLSIGILLPFVAINYDLLRLYQQLLIFLSLSVILGSLVILSIFFRKIKYSLAALLFITFFLLTTGYIPQLVGGQTASMQLNNYGEDYNRFYIHDSETKSARWLSSNYDKKYLIYADRFASWILMSFGNITTTQEDVLPSTLDQNSYVYLRYANAIQGINFKRFNDNFIYFNYPTHFLDQNKNLIYNDGDSKTYK